mgnify:CR=1 FL=1|jgi:hypothetical protein
MPLSPQEAHTPHKEKTVQINLEENEINAILAILGDMPSKSGTWPLMMKIKVQADAQLVEPEEDEGDEEEPEAEAAVQ